MTGRLRSTQASTKSKLGVKEEAQRFLNVEDAKAQGGSATATLTANVAHSFGDPEAMLGAVSSFGAGGNVAGTLSAERSHSATTGSGDIRGMVIWGNSILYLSDFEFTVQVVTPDARFPDPGTNPDQDVIVAADHIARGPVQMGLRIPELHQAQVRGAARAGGVGRTTRRPARG